MWYRVSHGTSSVAWHNEYHYHKIQVQVKSRNRAGEVAVPCLHLDRCGPVEPALGRISPKATACSNGPPCLGRGAMPYCHPITDVQMPGAVLSANHAGLSDPLSEFGQLGDLAGPFSLFRSSMQSPWISPRATACSNGRPYLGRGAMPYCHPITDVQMPGTGLSANHAGLSDPLSEFGRLGDLAGHFSRFRSSMQSPWISRSNSHFGSQSGGFAGQNAHVWAKTRGSGVQEAPRRQSLRLWCPLPATLRIAGFHLLVTPF